jgi:hypothetical protein
MWLIFLTATAGLIGLGLVVVNAGALYRLRYVFWIMLIIIAAQGILLDYSPHPFDEVVNVCFRRVERAHQANFRNRFVPNVKRSTSSALRYELLRHDLRRRHSPRPLRQRYLAPGHLFQFAPQQSRHAVRVRSAATPQIARQQRLELRGDVTHLRRQLHALFANVFEVVGQLRI